MKNDYEIRGEFTAIFLKRRNKPYLETLIDTEDLETVMSFPNTWSCNFMRNTETFYTVGDFRKDGKRGKVLLHRLIGVCWHKSTGKWYASIKLNGKCKYLGLFDDIREAERVAIEARKKMMPYFIDKDEII